MVQARLKTREISSLGRLVRLCLLDAVLQLEAAGVGGGGAGVARVVRQLGEGGPVVAPQQQHAAGGGPGHVVLPVILQSCPCEMYDVCKLCSVHGVCACIHFTAMSWTYFGHC